jgi:hypothetical protein
VKIPRLRCLRDGMRANRIEADTWREGWRHEYYSELRPVLASLPFGIAPCHAGCSHHVARRIGDVS